MNEEKRKRGRKKASAGENGYRTMRGGVAACPEHERPCSIILFYRVLLFLNFARLGSISK